MWQINLIIFAIFSTYLAYFFFKNKKINKNFFLILIFLKIFGLIVYDLGFNDKYKSFYAKYKFDSDGYTNLARQYAGFSHFDRNINKLDIKNKKEHFVKINDQYLFIDNEINQIQKFDKNLTLIEKNSLPGKIINSFMYEDFIIFSLADGSILKNKVPDLSLIKKRKLFDDDFITVLSVIDKKIYFGTFQGKFGNASFDLNENVNILDKSILSINNIIKYENKIFFSSIDGTIKEVKKNGKINIFFKSPKKIIDFRINDGKMYILRNSANLKVCDLIKEPTSCKTHGDNLNFFTSIFFDKNQIILGDAFGGITKLNKNYLAKLNNQPVLNFYSAPHKSFVKFIDINKKNKNLVSYSPNDSIILQNDEVVLKKISLTKVKDNKIFGLFYDNFRLPGYPILSALSMKVLKIESALAIIIVQKLVLFLFIFWVFKKLNKLKVNNLGFAIVSFFILFPFSVIINFAESDLTEFFLFILFSILTYNTIFERNSKKKHFVCLLIIIVGSLIKSTFTLITIFWFLSFLIFDLFFKKEKFQENIFYIIFPLLILITTSNIFKEQTIYNSGVLPAYIISLDKKEFYNEVNKNSFRINSNISNFLKDVQKLKFNEKDQQKYIFEILGYYDHLVIPIYYNNIEIKPEDIKKYGLQVLLDNNINYLSSAFKNQLSNFKEFNLIPGSYGSDYYKNDYFFVHLTLILIFYIFLFLFIYGILIQFKKNRIISFKLVTFLLMHIFFYIFLHDNFNQRYFFPIGIIYYYFVFIGLKKIFDLIPIKFRNP